MIFDRKYYSSLREGLTRSEKNSKDYAKVASCELPNELLQDLLKNRPLSFPLTAFGMIRLIEELFLFSFIPQK